MAEIIVVKEKLRQLRASADWDQSMLQMFTMWEKQIDWAEDNEESFYRMPKVVELSSILEERLRLISQQINNNRDLTTNQRQLLFMERDLTEIELGTFRYADAVESIEKAIDFEAEIFAKKQSIEDGIDDEDNLS
jgi:hypothetical protein